MVKRKFKCCICEQIFEGYGNNPYPVSKDPDDRCCDICNDARVIPERLLNWFSTNKDNNIGE